MDADQKHPPEAIVPGVEPLEPRSTRTSPTRQRIRRRTGTGDHDLDDRIAQLVKQAPFAIADDDLLTQSIESLFRMARSANRGEMKLVARSIRELGRAFRVFAPYRDRRKVAIFGSARTDPADPDYVTARDLGAAMVRDGWMVITGAGPGIMAAGHEGAGAKQSFGVGIKLPMEQGANGFIAGDPKLIDFKYFFTRKITFMKESDAFVLLPGGYGTMDEAFELLTLMQTGKTAIRPVLLLEARGGSYWDEWLGFVREHLIERGLCSPEDLALIERCEGVEEAAAAVKRFYTNYHSARYVGERLVIRLQRLPSKSQFADLNEEFNDIVSRGRIESAHISPAESHDDDAVDMQRLAFYPRSNFGRIRQLIDSLNRL